MTSLLSLPTGGFLYLHCILNDEVRMAPTDQNAAPSAHYDPFSISRNEAQYLIGNLPSSAKRDATLANNAHHYLADPAFGDAALQDQSLVMAGSSPTAAESGPMCGVCHKDSFDYGGHRLT